MIRFFFFFCATLLTFKMEAFQLHVILVGDTSRCEWLSLPTIQKDLDNMEKTVCLISDQVGVEMTFITFYGSTTRYLDIFEHIRSLDVQEEDIILFYFKGYGYRTSEKKGAFPYIYFGGDKLGLDFADICSEILYKRPRFLLAFADCMNVTLPYYLAPNVKKSLIKHSLEEDLPFMPAYEVSRGFKKLFGEFSGSILLSACAPDSIYDYTYRDGSSFFKAFLESLLFEVYLQEDADWITLLTKMDSDLKGMPELGEQEMLITIEPSSINAILD